MGIGSTPTVTAPTPGTGQMRDNGGSLMGLVMRLAVVLLVLGLASWVVMPTWYVALAGISTQGTVKTLQDCGGPGSATAKATIQFLNRSGQRHLASTPWCGDYLTGETVSLWYLPNDPDAIVTPNDLESLFAVTGLIALFDVVFVAVFVRALWQRLKARSRSPV